MKHASAIALAAGGVVAAAVVGGRFAPRPDRPATLAWYAALRKPAFTPPGAVIGVAWTILYALLGIAGYRLLTAPAGPERTRALGFWSATVSGLAGWPWLFFGRRSVRDGLAAIAAMFSAAVAAVVAAARVDRPAALAIVPVALWVGFASMLNADIWRRNRAAPGLDRLAAR